jgi:hypothetical protein
MDDCSICGGKGFIVYGPDTEGGRKTRPCECTSTKGKLLIHRDIPGTHETGNPKCFCEPFIFDEDDPRSPIEIIRYMEEKSRKQ